MSAIRFVCSFSGGITSWAAAKRIVEAEGRDGVVLLFADTLIEDEDCYRFLDDAAANIGLPVTRIADGRDPWQVFRDKRFLGNTRVDLCSRVLKRELLDRWTKEHAPNAVRVVGLAWDEQERIARFTARMAPQQVRAPLGDQRPWMSKANALDWARREGLRPPRMYDMGFAHANCGGFCVKAGQAAFALLLARFPERYLAHEAQEEAIRAELGDVSIMRDRRGGETRPLTMRELRKRVHCGEQIDMFDLGGCGCAIDVGDAA